MIKVEGPLHVVCQCDKCKNTPPQRTEKNTCPSVNLNVDITCCFYTEKGNPIDIISLTVLII
jgi:hypothetical protein